MDSSTSTRVDFPSDFPLDEGPHRPPRPGIVLAAWILGGVVVLLGGLLVGLRASRDGALPGILLADVAVGGLGEADLRAAVEDYADARADRPVVVERPAPQGNPGREARLEAVAGDLGYTLDVDATVERVLARGRQANPAQALVDQVRAFATTTEVTPVERVDATALDAWTGRAADALLLPPVEGSVAIEGTTVSPVQPLPGAGVDIDELRRDAEVAATAAGPATLTAVVEPVPPTTTADDVDQVVALAQQAVSAPVTLRRPSGAVTFSPEQIGSALRVVPAEPDGLDLTADAAAVGALVTDPAALETDPVSATVVLQGATPVVVPGTQGFVFDPAAAAAQLVEVATGEGPRDVQLDGTVTDPERTTEEAQALGITEKVSEFTTEHACCQNRVSNIQRIADLVDGVIISPGDTFSVNGFVGERTVEKGFLADGAISDGEFIEAVGGGVSQFATTMFNAAYFGGYEIPEHKPHSQYISRYPEGREATLNFPNVDLKVTNDSPHGILIDTSYTGTSITVAFWGTTWVQVDSATGERRNFRSPETIVRRTSELPSGASRVVQTGSGQGFDVTVTRTLTFPDGRTESRRFVTSYVARPEIIERGR